MDAQAVLIVGGVVGTLAKFVNQAGVSGRMTSWAAFGLSTVTVGIWAYSHVDVFDRKIVWDYFSGWAAVLLIAAGAFHSLEEAPKTAAMRAMTGTGDGSKSDEPKA